MFSQVFDWAGQFRTIHIRKAPEAVRREAFFIPFDQIASEGEKAVRNFSATLRDVRGGTIERVAENLADVRVRMNDIHALVSFTNQSLI
jgi:fido (protein-threonine AMPylation protein)